MTAVKIASTKPFEGVGMKIERNIIDENNDFDVMNIIQIFDRRRYHS